MNVETWNESIYEENKKVLHEDINPVLWNSCVYLEPVDNLEALTPFWSKYGLPQNDIHDECPVDMISLAGDDYKRFESELLMHETNVGSFPFYVLQWFMKEIYPSWSLSPESSSHMVKLLDEKLFTYEGSWAEWWNFIWERNRHSAWFWLSIWMQISPNTWIYVKKDNESSKIGQTDKIFFEIKYNKCEYTETYWRNFLQQIDFTPFKIEDKDFNFDELTIQIVYSERSLGNPEHPLCVQRWLNVGIINTCFHEGTYDWLNWIVHDRIRPWVFFLFRIWIRWMSWNVEWRHRGRFIWSGGMIKNAYHIREATDVDFWVLDHQEVLTKYYPKLHNTNTQLKLFQDFGRTYYACEDYFFPTRPDMYHHQNIHKVMNTPTTQDMNTVSDIFRKQFIPNYSASGLKVGRFSTIYRYLWRRFRSIWLENGGNEDDYMIYRNLDEFIVHPCWGFYRWGVKHASIESEFLRDHIKDLDLGKVSKKQKNDWLGFYKMYKKDIPDYWWNAMGISSTIKQVNDIMEWDVKPFLRWNWNLYHGEKMQNIGFHVLIRKTPLFLHNTIQNLLQHGGFKLLGKEEQEKPKPWRWGACSSGIIIHHWNDQYVKGREMTHYRQVLLSSLPVQISYKNKNYGGPATWWWVLTQYGEIHVQLMTHPWNIGSTVWHLAQRDLWYMAGICQMVNDDKNKDNLIFRCSVYKGDETLEVLCTNDKLYQEKVIQMLKVIFQLHRIHDVLETRKIAFEYIAPNSLLLEPDWEALPWIQDERNFWEGGSMKDRWIPFPSLHENWKLSCIKWQNKYGYSSSHDMIDIWKKRLNPLLRKNVK